jgi:hypothetical protein
MGAAAMSDTSHTASEALLRAALKWALQGNHVATNKSGFRTKGCGCCEYNAEPPTEIDALVREVRRELLPDEQQVTGEQS